MENLTVIRDQIYTMVQFMRDTPDPHHGDTWWAGDMPHDPALYDPASWEDEGDEPIIHIWYSYLLDLYTYSHEMEEGDAGDALRAHLHRSKSLSIGDALACSRERASDYWRTCIGLFESQYGELL